MSLPDSWICLMVKGGPGLVPEDVKRTLKMAACDLKLKDLPVTFQTGETCKVEVTTKWVRHTVGTCTGFLFYGEVHEGRKKSYRVNFLLNAANLREGARILKDMIAAGEDGEAFTVTGKLPVDELYRFDDLGGHTRRRLH